MSTKIGATTVRTGRPFLRHFSRPQVLRIPAVEKRPPERTSACLQCAVVCARWCDMLVAWRDLISDQGGKTWRNECGACLQLLWCCGLGA